MPYAIEPLTGSPETGMLKVAPNWVTEGRSRRKLTETAPRLAICIPTRWYTSPEFWVNWLKVTHPLLMRCFYLINKSFGENNQAQSAPALARELLTLEALSLQARWAFFIDDDVLCPDKVLYQLMARMPTLPQAAVIGPVVTTRTFPPEPMIYKDENSGSYWGFRLGEAEEVWALSSSCFLVDLDYVRRLEPPYWEDCYEVGPGQVGQVHIKDKQWGHDIAFCRKIASVGGKLYLDAGLICDHFDIEKQKLYTLPQNSPPFRRENINTPEYWDREWEKRLKRGVRVCDLLYDKVVEEIPPNTKVIELGAGAAILGQRLVKEKECEVVAIDFSPYIVNHVNRLGIPGLTASCLDLVSNGVPDGDWYVAVELLEHLDDPSRLLSHICHRSGVFTVPSNRLGPEEFHEHQHRYTSETLKSLLEGYYSKVVVQEVEAYLVATCYAV